MNLLAGSYDFVCQPNVIVDLLQFKMGVGQVGIQRQGPTEVCDGGLMWKAVSRRPCELRARQIRLGEVGINRQRSLNLQERLFVKAVVGGVVEKELGIGAGQRRPGQRELGIEGHRALELRDRRSPGAGPGLNDWTGRGTSLEVPKTTQSAS